MEEYTIGAQGLADLKTLITKRLLVTFSMLAMIVALVYFGSGSSLTLAAAVPYLLFIGAVLIFSFYNGIKKQMQLFKSYRLVITEDSITREQHNTPTIIILKKDVTRILKDKKGSIGVFGNSKLNAIAIPAQIEKINSLERHLQEVKPIEHTKGKDLGIWILLIITTGVIALFYLMIKVENNIISGFAGLAVLAYLIYSFFVIQKSKNIDRRVKHLSYIAWIPILSLAAIVIKKLLS